MFDWRNKIKRNNVIISNPDGGIELFSQETGPKIIKRRETLIDEEGFDDVDSFWESHQQKEDPIQTNNENDEITNSDNVSDSFVFETSKKNQVDQIRESFEVSMIDEEYQSDNEGKHDNGKSKLRQNNQHNQDDEDISREFNIEGSPDKDLNTPSQSPLNLKVRNHYDNSDTSPDTSPDKNNLDDSNRSTPSQSPLNFKIKNHYKTSAKRGKPTTVDKLTSNFGAIRIREGKRRVVKPLKGWENERLKVQRDNENSPAPQIIKPEVKLVQIESMLSKKKKKKEENYEVICMVETEVEDREQRVAIKNNNMKLITDSETNLKSEVILEDDDFMKVLTMIIPKNKEKPERETGNSSLCIYIEDGELTITINKTEFIVSSKTHIIIPRQNNYSLKGNNHKDSKITIVCAKDKLMDA
eukprot:GHVP01000004.1.p1 GENE.GHVP01000004.1~~GHVP01000004.1.p1  ORF type:complete len:413 (+),score=84.45 GHVP01000004.1:3-1241(+)